MSPGAGSFVHAGSRRDPKQLLPGKLLDRSLPGVVGGRGVVIPGRLEEVGLADELRGGRLCPLLQTPSDCDPEARRSAT